MLGQPTYSDLGEPMSWERYWSLPEALRAEYSDGRVFVTPTASFRHQLVSQRLCDVLRRDLPSAVVVQAVGWRLVEQPPRLRIPDLMVLGGAPIGDVVTDPPAVVIEVLSTNRGADLVRKATEYLSAGAGQYWIVDPRDRVIECFANRGSGWETLARLSDEETRAAVVVAPFGTVDLDVAGTFA
jgi:Uma2 family endonuclease